MYDEYLLDLDYVCQVYIAWLLIHQNSAHAPEILYGMWFRILTSLTMEMANHLNLLSFTLHSVKSDRVRVLIHDDL